MKSTLLAIALLLSNAIFSQEAADFVPNQLIIKISPAYYNQGNIQLANRSFGIAALDQLGALNQLSKMESIGQHSKTQTFLLTFSAPVNYMLQLQSGTYSKVYKVVRK